MFDRTSLCHQFEPRCAGKRDRDAFDKRHQSYFGMSDSVWMLIQVWFTAFVATCNVLMVTQVGQLLHGDEFMCARLIAGYRRRNGTAKERKSRGAVDCVRPGSAQDVEPKPADLEQAYANRARQASPGQGRTHPFGCDHLPVRLYQGRGYRALAKYCPALHFSCLPGCCGLAENPKVVLGVAG